ncbi:LGFP repeat-containing protein [Dactylosporangium sp. CS-047395]|uniref:LGFP repeat-containing protein n=1 Tax=Dactylosporangium sp. CS-047395 TaxID=3239936 RepID=UPI003D94752D
MFLDGANLNGGNPMYVTDPYSQLWTDHGRENGDLGYPLNLRSRLSGGQWQAFERGFVFNRDGQAPYAVTRPVSDTWTRQGRENGPLGWPTGQRVTCAASPSSPYQTFDGGIIAVDGAGRATLNPPAPCPETTRAVNGDFAQPSGTGPTTITASPGMPGGWSAARAWPVTINTPTTTSTALLPTTRAPAPAGKSMLKVCSTGAYNGLAQAFAAPGTGSPAIAYVWVYVEQGRIGVGIGNGGSTGLSAQSTQTGRWEPVTATSGNDPGNEIIITTLDPDGACYYLDTVTVQNRT